MPIFPNANTAIASKAEQEAVQIMDQAPVPTLPVYIPMSSHNQPSPETTPHHQPTRPPPAYTQHTKPTYIPIPPPPYLAPIQLRPPPPSYNTSPPPPLRTRHSFRRYIPFLKPKAPPPARTFRFRLDPSTDPSQTWISHPSVALDPTWRDWRIPRDRSRQRRRHRRQMYCLMAVVVVCFPLLMLLLGAMLAWDGVKAVWEWCEGRVKGCWKRLCSNGSVLRKSRDMPGHWVV